MATTKIIETYPVPHLGTVEIMMPTRARPRAVGVVGGVLNLFAEVPLADMHDGRFAQRRFRILGTGQRFLDDGLRYIGTAFIATAPTVVHAFAERAS